MKKSEAKVLLINLLQTLRFKSLPDTAEAILRWADYIKMLPPEVTEERPGGSVTYNDWEKEVDLKR